MTPSGVNARAVLFVHHGGDWIRGLERCLIDVATGIDRSRYHAVVWCNAGPVAEALHGSVARVYRDPDMVPATWSGRALSSSVRSTVSLLRRERIRLVHANTLAVMPVLVVACRMLGIPIVVQLHWLYDAYERLVTGLHQASAITGVSGAVVTGVRNDGYPQSRLSVIHNGIDPRRIRPDDVRRVRADLGIADDEVVIACVGSLIPRKAVDVLLHASARLLARGARHRLWIIGDGECARALRQQTEELRLQDVVTFLGERADAAALVRDAVDVLAAPAREEAFGLTLIEAGWGARPVVASDVDGHREIVQVGSTGFLVPRDDPGALAAGLEPLVRDPALRHRLGTAGRARVLDKFMVAQHVCRLQALYDRTIAARRLPIVGGWTWVDAYSRWLGRKLLPQRPSQRIAGPS